MHISHCRHTFVFFTLLISCLLLAPVFGLQESPPEREDSDQTRPSALPAGAPHHEITVTATRTETAVRELGRSVTIISAEEIRLQGADSLSEVLANVPGFSLARVGTFGGQTSLFARGGESSFNLVLIDGVPINQPGGFFDFADLSTANVERIEIVRGPASVLYGTEAVSSTINIITARGDGRPAGSLRLEGGSYDTLNLRGAVRGSEEWFHYSAGVSRSSTDGIYDFNSQYDRSEFSGKFDFDLGPGSMLSANVRYSDSEQHFPTDETGAVVDPNDFRENRQGVYSLGYEKRFNSKYRSKLLYGFHDFDSNIFTLRDDITDFYEDVFAVETNRHYLDWQNDLEWGDNHLMTGGLSYKREASILDGFNRRSVGGYFQNRSSWNDRLFATAGLRYDNNDAFSSFLTTNFDLAYLATQEFKLRMNLGNGFRAPEFAEIIGFPLFGISGNPDLEPERNFASEFGADFYSAGGRSRLSATFFMNSFSDLIEFSFLVPPGTPNYQNIEKASSRGVELEGLTHARGGLWLGFNYSLARTRVEDTGLVPGDNFKEGEKLLRRPTHSGLLFASYSSPSLRGRLSFRYTGDRDDRRFFPDFSNTRVTLPGFWRMDFNLEVPVLRRRQRGEVSLVLRGENLLDEEYVEIAGFESPGRTLLGGLRFLF